MSRNGNTFKQFTDLCTRITERYGGHSAILDGEIVCPDGDSRPVFAGAMLPSAPVPRPSAAARRARPGGGCGQLRRAHGGAEMNASAASAGPREAMPRRSPRRHRHRSRRRLVTPDNAVRLASTRGLRRHIVSLKSVLKSSRIDRFYSELPVRNML